MFGLLGHKLYVIGSIFWLFFAICHWNIRKAAPSYPEFGIFIGWFILAVFAVGLIFAALHETGPRVP